MCKRYSRQFKDQAVRLLEQSRANYSSEHQAMTSVADNLGVAAESLRRWEVGSRSESSPLSPGNLKK